MPPSPRIAIVGSRALMRTNGACIEPLVEMAASYGLSVVSGGARGADIEAHRAALRAQTPQLCVLPCGRDQVYPPEHADDFEAIASAPYSGVLFGAQAHAALRRQIFASRNRIVVGLSDGVIVVQASLRSGSLGTGRAALKAQRPCAAFLSSPGGQSLVGEGAMSLRFAGEDGWRARAEAFFERVISPMAASLETSEPTWPAHIAWLAEAMRETDAKGVTAGQLGDPLRALCALTEACSLGLVVETSPGRYRRARE